MFSDPSPNNFSNGLSLNCLYSELSSLNDAPAMRDSYIYIEDITRWREDMNFIFEWQNNLLWMSAASE